MADSFPEFLLDEIAALLLPLQTVVDADDPVRALERFLRGVGWRSTVTAEVDSVLTTIEGLNDTLALLRADPIPDTLEEAVTLLESVAGLSASLRSVGTGLASGPAPGPVSADAAAAFAEDVTHYLLLSRLARLPVLYATLELLGFVDTVAVEAEELGGWLERREGNRARLQVSALPAFLNAPVDQILSRLANDGWRSPSEAVATNLVLFSLFRPLLGGLGGTFRLHPNLFRDEAGPLELGRTSLLEFVLPTPEGPRVRFGVALEMLSAEDTTPGGAAGPAVTLTPFGSFAQALTAGNWQVDVLATATTEADGSPAPAFTLGAGGAEAADGVAARIQVDAERPLSLNLGGSSTGLQLGDLRLAAFGALASGEPDFGFSISAANSSVGLSTADLGAAIESLASFEASLDFDLGLAWSLQAGLTLAGEVSLEIPIAEDLSIGGLITLADLRLVVGVSDTIDLELLTDLSLSLGPLFLAFDDLGLAVTLEFGVEQGNLGGADLALGLRLPTGIGMQVDAAVARGGGLATVNYEAGEYAGILDVELLEIGLTAMGLIATKGAEGWSMFLSLSATFTGLQLGFGFTLNGVGGLIGANRGLDAEALGDGVRTGALDSILFPEDPIADGLQILSDLDAIFPAAAGQWVFGPIAKIGWGTPTLIEIDLGVIVQLPDPLTITLLGALECVLPTAEAAILELRIDVAGTLNLTEGTLAVDASLRDSQVAGFTLTGDVAIRASFFDQPSFLFSFGGFHPEFTPPESFPTLNRVGISLDTGDNLRVQLGGYFAVTSNTLQFGASAEFWAKAAGVTASGGVSFDALIQFKPFGLIIGLEIWVDIDAGSVELLAVLLSATLKGPNPWYVQGKASFKLLGIKTSLEVEATFGDAEDQEPREVVLVEELLLEELRQADAWTALPPDGDGEGVIVSDTTDATLSVHPAGRLEVRQRVVPLGRRIDHYGEAVLGGADTFELTDATIGSAAVTGEDAEEWFAAAQYWDLSEDEKLMSPSFEEMPAGLRLGDDGVEAGDASEFTVDHEVVYRDPLARSDDRNKLGTLFTATAEALSRGLRLGSSLQVRTSAGLPRSTAPTGSLIVEAVQFTAVQTHAGIPAEGLGTSQGTSFFAARDAVAGADSTEDLAVLPAYELELLG